MTRTKVALAHYIPGGLDEIVAAAGPDDFETVRMDVQASEEAQSEVLKDADALFFVFGRKDARRGLALVRQNRVTGAGSL